MQLINSNMLTWKITKSVVKYLRIMFLSLFTLYSDLSTTLVQLTQLHMHMVAASKSEGVLTSEQLLSYSPHSSGSHKLMGKTEIATVRTTYTVPLVACLFVSQYLCECECECEWDA